MREARQRRQPIARRLEGYRSLEHSQPRYGLYVLSSIDITSQYDHATLLASVATPPFQIPLTANPPEDISWLTPLSIPVHTHLSNSVTAWLEFARESWRSGYAVARVTISHADIKGGPWEWRTWRSVFTLSRSNLTLGLRMKSTSVFSYCYLLL